jgi:hypothetical protein
VRQGTRRPRRTLVHLRGVAGKARRHRERLAGIVEHRPPERPANHEHFFWEQRPLVLRDRIAVDVSQRALIGDLGPDEVRMQRLELIHRPSRPGHDLRDTAPPQYREGRHHLTELEGGLIPVRTVMEHVVQRVVRRKLLALADAPEDLERHRGDVLGDRPDAGVDGWDRHRRVGCHGHRTRA